jgi:hypothetical protein
MPSLNKNRNGDDSNGGSLNGGSDHHQLGTNIVAMEMESLHPSGGGQQSVRRQNRQSSSSSSQQSSGEYRMHPLTSLWMLIKLHLEYYPKISSIVGISLLAFLMYLAVEASKPPLARHKLTHDYTDIDAAYNWKAAQIDHWCLFVRLFAVNIYI